MILGKYNASGNDFAIFHSFLSKDRSALARRLCDRFSGVGADGLIVLLPADDSSCDVKWEFYNSDGSVASMCGNGSRAAALYAYENGLASANMRIKTLAGIIEASISDDISDKKLVEVALTSPKKLRDSFSEQGWQWHFYDTGVPHLITFTQDLNDFDKELARHMRHKYNANVNYALIQNNESIKVRTFERGVEDETMACGTGMAASFYAGYDLGELNASINVYPKSNELLFLRFENGKIYFKGVLSHSFDAVIKDAF